MKKTVSEDWEQLPDTEFILQCQTKRGMRIVKSETKPTDANDGYLLEYGKAVNTDVDDFLIGTCWIKAMFGDKEDYNYESRV